MGAIKLTGLTEGDLLKQIINPNPNSKSSLLCLEKLNPAAGNPASNLYYLLSLCALTFSDIFKLINYSQISIKSSISRLQHYIFLKKKIYIYKKNFNFNFFLKNNKIIIFLL